MCGDAVNLSANRSSTPHAMNAVNLSANRSSTQTRALNTVDVDAANAMNLSANRSYNPPML